MLYFENIQTGLRSQDPSLEAAWRNLATGTQSSSLTEADLKATRSSWPIIMFLGVVLGSPYVIWRLLSSLVQPKTPQSSQDWKKGVGEHYAAVAAYSFRVRFILSLNNRIHPLF